MAFTVTRSHPNLTPMGDFGRVRQCCPPSSSKHPPEEFQRPVESMPRLRNAIAYDLYILCTALFLNGATLPRVSQATTQRLTHILEQRCTEAPKRY